MGRLIDVADLNVALAIGVLYGNKTAIQVINEAPTVEAIPKADYENRLKADLKAILIELKLEIEEMQCLYVDFAHYVNEYDVSDLIQQKINALLAETEGK